jgi:hypothetical protein
MKLIKKISAIAASALMIGMSMGVAAAVNYPAPFVSGSSSDVAVVYGANTPMGLDIVPSASISQNLQSYLSGGGGTSTSVTGEAVELYTGGTKIYISDALNKVKTIVTDVDLPTVLADGSFSGNVDATYVQTIVIGNNPNVTYEKQPTSSDDPNLALKISTSPSSTPAYNLSVTFSKAVNFSHADSEGQDITLFGKEYTVGSATDGTNLVLLQSAERLSLSSDSPTADVTIGGKTYTIELVSASDSAATIKVTDDTGASEQKEVSEAQSKKIKGITVAVTNADETNLKLSASVVAGSEKITFTDSSYVKVGESDTAILGTDVDFHGGTPAAGLSKMTVGVSADDSDEDAIQAGESLVDPVFKTVKLSLGGFNIDEDSTSRETITVQNSGDDKMEVTFTDYNGDTKTIRYAKFGAGAGTTSNNSLFIDDDHHNISVREGEKIHRGDYVVVGNEDDGHILKVSSVVKVPSAGTTASGDALSFTDVMSGDTITANLNANTTDVSSGTVTVGGKSYNVYVQGLHGTNSDLYNISIDYPDSASGEMIVYPTIKTRKGAKIAFYEPLNNISICAAIAGLDCVAGGDSEGPFGWSNITNLSKIKFPNGADTYQDVTITWNSSSDDLNFACGTTTSQALVGIGAAAGTLSCNLTSAGIGYNITYAHATNTTSIRLTTAIGTPIEEPAIVIIEEKDDNNVYETLIVTTESGASSEDGIGVNDVDRSWADDGVWDSTTMASDSKKEKEMDLWGTVVLTDKGDSDQAKVTISYPDEQVYALLYMGEESSSIGVIGGGGGTQLGEILVKDTEVSSVSTKNLIVVGGSCINSVAANLVGAAHCGDAWTSATSVGSGQFLIQSFGDAYTTGKVALLVAGYEAADTVNAAKYLTTQTVDTTAGKKYRGTSSTSAELVTESA